jgi:hypothetical protein
MSTVEDSYPIVTVDLCSILVITDLFTLGLNDVDSSL